MKIRFFASLSLTTLALTSCDLAPRFSAPSLDLTQQWKETQNASAQNTIPDQWWRLFADPKLSSLIQQALHENQDIAAAKSRVDTAQALVRVGRSALFPELGLTSSAGWSRASPAAMLFPIQLERGRYTSDLTLSYDLDLFGKNRNNLVAKTAQANAALDLLDAQRLGVATEVARQYFLVRGLDAQHAILQKTIAARDEQTHIQKIRSDAGLESGINLESSRALAELAKNDLASVARQRSAAEHALAVLCGVTPSQFSLAPQKPLAPLPRLHVALPAEALARRPDVRASEAQLRALNAKVGIAKAQLFPDLSIRGVLGLDTFNTNNFAQWENRTLSYGANLAVPLFQGGAGSANIDSAKSAYQEALALHRKTLLTALQETEDAISDTNAFAQSRQSLQRALAAAKAAHSLSQERYKNGIGTYLEVLDADRTCLQIQLALAQVEAQQRISLTALVKSLGGGWSRR